MMPPKISVMLSAIVVLALLIAGVLPATPLLAESANIELDPSAGAAGTKISITGTDFTEDYYYYVFFDEDYKTKGTISSSGTFTRTYTIPDVDDGTYEIAVMTKKASDSSPEYDDSYVDEATATFVVSSDPVISVNPDEATPGSEVTVYGANFESEYFYIFFDEEYQTKGSIDDGEFTKSFDIPDDLDEDTYEIVVKASASSVSSPDIDDDFDEEATFDFGVIESDPAIEIDPESGEPGTSVTITGTGYTEDYYYYVFFDETYKSKGTVDSYGEFTKTLTIPSGTDAGTYEIAVKAKSGSVSSPDYDDSFSDEDEVDFEVISGNEATIGISPATGNVGEAFTISGSDFDASKTVTVYWDGSKLGSTFTSSSSGAFSSETYTVPECVYGTHTVKVMDSASNYATATYSVTPGVTLSTTTLTSGNTITVTGNGFSASSTMKFYLDGTALSTQASASTKGTLSLTSITISSTTPGSHTLKVQDASGYSDSVNITISAAVPTTTPAPTQPNTPAQNNPGQTQPTSPAQNNPGQTQPTSPAQNNPGQTQTTAAPAPNTGNNQPVKTTAAPVQTSNAPAANQAPAQTTAPQPQPAPKSNGSFPTWLIIVIVVVAVLVVAVIVLLIKSRKSQTK